MFFLYIDVTEPLLVEVDQIFHLACPASPIFYKHNPVKVCLYSKFNSKVTVKNGIHVFPNTCARSSITELPRIPMKGHSFS